MDFVLYSTYVVIAAFISIFTTVGTLWEIQIERQTDGLTTQLTTLNKVFLEKVCSCWSRNSLVMEVGSVVLCMTACLWMLS